MSYLSPLRLHFAGKFQAAPSTVNNDPTNYNPKNTQLNDSWNPKGDATWRLIGCRVTAAWHANGSPAASDDLILRCLIADSDRRAPAKLVDLDPQQQLASAIWGLEVRICDTNGTTLLRGQFETASFMDIWYRTKGGSDDSDAGVMYQSVLSELEWGQLDRSPFLMELHRAAQDGLLSIKFNVDGYNRESSSAERTRGRIVGTIGPATSSEPRHFVGGRQFIAIEAPNSVRIFVPQNNINFCTAVVDQQAGKVLLDLGNALQTKQRGGPLLDQGELSMVCEVQSSPSGTLGQRLSLGSIPYTEEGWYERTAGVVELPRNRRLAQEELHVIATNPLSLLLSDHDHPAPLTTSEAHDGLYVRADQFVFRLNPGEQVEVRLFATRFGQPYAGAQIQLNADIGQLQGQDINIGIPVNAIEYPESVVTGEDGVATITILGHDPGNPRKSLYLDGQLYGIRPVLKENASAGNNYPVNPWNFISLLLFDDFHADEPPTWLGSLQPIFQQYQKLYPVMDRFLNLADYESVCANRQLLLLTFSLEAEHPNAMPVTRDLSAAKRKAILRWLTETGQDGKPLLGTQSATHAAQRGRIVPTPSPHPQAEPQEPFKGSKTEAASRRLALGNSAGQS